MSQPNTCGGKPCKHPQEPFLTSHWKFIKEHTVTKQGQVHSAGVPHCQYDVIYSKMYVSRSLEVNCDHLWSFALLLTEQLYTLLGQFVDLPKSISMVVTERRASTEMTVFPIFHFFLHTGFKFPTYTGFEPSVEFHKSSTSLLRKTVTVFSDQNKAVQDTLHPL